MLVYAKMFASAAEKMCMNGYYDLYDSDFVNEKYEQFKIAMNGIEPEFVSKNLEEYRALSVITLKYSKVAYKNLFPAFIYLKNKNYNT